MPGDAVRLDWSRWSRCESSFNLLLAPQQPGIFALAEEVVDAASAGGKRILAVLEIAPADDLARALSWLFSSGSALRDRLLSGNCFVRYAVVPDLTQRDAIVAQLQQWVSASADVATGLNPPPVAAADAASSDKAKVISPSPLPAGF
ncbi:MAG TPA: hypothetical protein VL382_03875 [Terriglobales bacterium]|nr:hypothetical protein [Terriglobales bacterium]